WDFSGTLISDNVWDGYIIMTLWEECHAQAEPPFTVPHTGYQKERFHQAMWEHTEHIYLNGFDTVSHYCDKCIHFFIDVNG
ncbi:hypothetical protein EDD85DRAFT_734781, partial [Armillaria nabsnona]